MPTLEDITDAEDIDNLDMDLAEFDPDLVTPVAPIHEEEKEESESEEESEDEATKEIRRKAAQMQKSPMTDPSVGSFNQGESPIPGTHITTDLTDEEKKELASMQCIYPCYFDINRSVSQGRRAPKKYCVENPLAKTVLDATKNLHIPSMLETDKSHPQDFGNPGRVRLAIKFQGKPVDSKIQSKRQVLALIGQYMVEHPTTLASVKQMPGPPELMRPQYKPMEVPKVKGFTMNTIVPLHSPFTMKNPETAGAYSKMHTPPTQQQKKQKIKIKRIRV